MPPHSPHNTHTGTPEAGAAHPPNTIAEPRERHTLSALPGQLQTQDVCGHATDPHRPGSERKIAHDPHSESDSPRDTSSPAPAARLHAQGVDWKDRVPEDLVQRLCRR